MQIALQRYEITHKQIAKFLLFAIITAAIALAFSTVFAEAGKQKFMEQNCIEMMEKIQTNCASIATTILGKNYNESIYGDGTKFSNVSLLFQTFGLGFSMILFGFKLGAEFDSERDPVEGILKTFTQLCICIVCILMVEDFLVVIDELGTWMVKQIGEVDGAVASMFTADQMREAYGLGDNNFGWLALAIELLIPYIFYYIESVLARVTAYSILIELVVKRCFVPLAIADIGYEGLRSSGVRYIKNYFGIYIKEALLILVCIASAALCGAVNAVIDDSVIKLQVANAIFNCIAIGGSTCILMGKCGDWARDVVGG